MPKPIQEQIDNLRQAISAQEELRSTLGDALVDTTIGALQKQLAALQSQPGQPKQQRKQISILFADVSGFTAMSETMDAEEVSETMR